MPQMTVLIRFTDADNSHSFIEYENFTVCAVGVIVPETESDPESGTGEYLYPWHRVESIYTPELGSITATLPL